jgi:hypothetical protein
MSEEKKPVWGWIWKTILWVFSIFAAGFGGHEYTQRVSGEPSFYEQREKMQTDERIKRSEEHMTRIEDRFDRKFEVIDSKLDRIIDLQIRSQRAKIETVGPKISQETSRNIYKQGG